MDAAVVSHCPFHCSVSDCDELGYCRHLVGFSNDGKVFEPIVRVKNKLGEVARVIVSGRERQQVLKGDRLVNPERQQIDKGVVSLARAWVSSRVYREDTEAQLEELTRPETAAV